MKVILMNSMSHLIDNVFFFTDLSLNTCCYLTVTVKLVILVMKWVVCVFLPK